MYDDRKLNSGINKLQERALRSVYKDKQSKFNELSEKDKSLTVHERIIKVLATEIYKFENYINPSCTKEILEPKNLPHKKHKVWN